MFRGRSARLAFAAVEAAIATAPPTSSPRAVAERATLAFANILVAAFDCLRGLEERHVVWILDACGNVGFDGLDELLTHRRRRELRGAELVAGCIAARTAVAMVGPARAFVARGAIMARGPCAVVAAIAGSL